MGKVLWHATMQSDAFIAGPGDDMGWIAEFSRGNPVVDEQAPQIAAPLIGARTYQHAKTEQGAVYGGAWTGPQYVLTHGDASAAATGFSFLSGDIGARKASSTYVIPAVRTW